MGRRGNVGRGVVSARDRRRGQEVRCDSGRWGGWGWGGGGGAVVRWGRAHQLLALAEPRGGEGGGCGVGAARTSFSLSPSHLNVRSAEKGGEGAERARERARERGSERGHQLLALAEPLGGEVRRADREKRRVRLRRHRLPRRSRSRRRIRASLSAPAAVRFGSDRGCAACSALASGAVYVCVRACVRACIRASAYIRCGGKGGGVRGGAPALARKDLPVPGGP